MAELSKTDRPDEVDAVKFSELLHGRHFKGRFVLSVCMLHLIYIEAHLGDIVSNSRISF